jgi:SAM-dependent methyltransferase
MGLLDETLAEAAALRSTEAGPKPFDVAIELGAGSGRITPFLATRAGHLTAIEFVPEFSERNATLLAAKGINNVTCITADAREEKNLPASIDLAFVKWILLYLIDDDAVALLTQIVKRLTPGGVLFLNESCGPEGADSLYFDGEAKYIANYRPTSWYVKHLEALGSGTFSLTTVLDEAIYKKYLEEAGNGHSYPIIRFIKNP